MKFTKNLEELLDFDLPQDELDKFHKKTKLRKVHQMNPKRYPKAWTTLFYKGYPRFKEVSLSKPRLDKKISFLDTLVNRDSIRKYRSAKMPLSTVSNLLYYSFGLKDLKDPTKGRFYPSAGARYPIEIYLLSLNTDLDSGLYHYYFKSHSLEKLMPIKKFNFRDYSIPGGFRKASCLVIMTAVFDRGRIKYGSRAYPFAMMEAGHIGQNIYLVSAASKLSCCAVGGFNNYKVDELLDVDGVRETSIYIFAIGKS